MQPILMPFIVSTLNSVGKGINALGIEPVQITPESIKEAATRKTGLDDFGSDDINEGLEILCRSINLESNATLAGRIALFNHFTRALMMRLLRVRVEKDQPSIFETELIPPIIIIGLPRSGTTFLYKLMCQAPDVRTIPTWELRAPLTGAGIDLRRIKTRMEIALLKRVSPGIDAKHEIKYNEPEEDIFLFDSSFWSPSYFRMAPVFSYLEWQLAADPTNGYMEYKKFLQIFQAKSPGKRLILKNPEHTGFLGALVRAIPNAMIVQTHRNPVEVIASYNSLASSMHSSTCGAVDNTRMGQASLNLYGLSVERNLKEREKIPAGQIIDVLYDDLVADPIGVTRKIYRHFTLPFAPEFKRMLEKAIAESPQNKYGKHHYSLKEWGLTEDAVNGRFFQYRQHFGV